MPATRVLDSHLTGNYQPDRISFQSDTTIEVSRYAPSGLDKKSPNA